ncbi:hypothetical protein BpHYR1_009369 [Brachionus plicatilis]|uniref:Uncharacterized protein n=1 Tax=Brachionus plicatilis TaxID=10195 RepID=A0A3M7Q8Z7_BRAPC|nr:hypothetical protein BpHYR1_009369 [Brachionus plicatilis]
MKIPDRTETHNIAATPASTKYTLVKKFEQKLLVWLVISERGISAPIILKSGFAFIQVVYLDSIKSGKLLTYFLSLALIAKKRLPLDEKVCFGY